MRWIGGPGNRQVVVEILMRGQLVDVNAAGAISVATSTRVLPALKSSSAVTRAVWLLLPWMAAAGMFCLFASLRFYRPASLVVLNTSAFTFTRLQVFDEPGQQELCCLSPKIQFCWMWSTVLDTGPSLDKGRVMQDACGRRSSISPGHGGAEHQVSGAAWAAWLITLFHVGQSPYPASSIFSPAISDHAKKIELHKIRYHGCQ